MNLRLEPSRFIIAILSYVEPLMEDSPIGSWALSALSIFQQAPCVEVVWADVGSAFDTLTFLTVRLDFVGFLKVT